MPDVNSPPQTLTIRRPDDWHLHLRDGDMLSFCADYTAKQFARAIIMPNLVPPITTADMADAYRDRILAAVPEERGFTPLMTAYLTDTIDPAEIEKGFKRGSLTACKLYPANATTNSSSGVTDVKNLYSTFERMQAIGMPLLIHGEVVSPDVDIFDREALFIREILSPVMDLYPNLRIVLEHITTSDAVEFVKGADDRLAATITAHHLKIDRNDMFKGGIRPHAYCLPVAKRREHKLALRKAATSGNPKFFLGTDSAPHEREAKESACGCAGIFSAPFALETYLEIFEEEGAIDMFEGFASLHGPAFYKMPVNEETITLTRTSAPVPEQLLSGDIEIVPFQAGETLNWSLR